MKTSPVLLALLLGSTALSFGQNPAPSPGDGSLAAPITHGLRVFTVGHSFHYWVPPILLEISQSAGLKDATIAGLMKLGGSTVLQCWQIPNVPGRPNVPPINTAKEALTAGTVDVLTLSPIWMPDEGIDDFAALAVQHNPNIRVTVQEFWMPNDTYEPKYPLDVHKQPTVDHNAVDLAALQKAQQSYDHDVEAYVRAINQKLGKDVIAIVPVGRAAVALREKVAAGQAPGIEKQAELFRDPWGHPKAPLEVLAAYCHYAVIYRQSPVGLPIPQALTGQYHTDALNRLLQKLAWDAVVHDPMSQVKVSQPTAGNPG